ncbi:60S ribosomal protein L27-A [Zancudomyces culisetae]|uniref:60S ribosomal protein L27 n=1 Tax=Zancudomyces culisetae TaxID=1213189 RepID=A0A1R1PTF4_ZANCU|nr:60S ribosomal protein L27-A [Zancudomyces culisetae]|eukprot:OMH84209.1 60S ribosomal protein L27-A [Zancudomyces culisetae]
MPKFLKPGKVVIILQGRYAGKKAVIIKNYDEGTADRQYGYCTVAGIERYPLKVTRSMGVKKIARRSRIKPFIKVVNYNHVMPTRYGMELEKIKESLNLNMFKDPTQRAKSRKAIKSILQERYTAGKNKWFFSKLRF